MEDERYVFQEIFTISEKEKMLKFNKTMRLYGECEKGFKLEMDVNNEVYSMEEKNNYEIVLT